MNDETKHDSTDSASEALKHPEPPDQEAVTQHANEGDGPFGADMQTTLGGTRPNDGRQRAGQDSGNPYSTGTHAPSGASTTPDDPRSTIGHDGTSSATDTEADSREDETGAARA